MSLLQTTYKFLTIVGIKPLPKKYFPSNFSNFQMVFNGFHIIFALTTIVTFAVSIMCFLMFEAISFTQFSEAGLFYMVAYLHASFYTISVVKRSKIFSFMESLESIIKKSMAKNTKFDWNSIFVLKFNLWFKLRLWITFQKHYRKSKSRNSCNLRECTQNVWEIFNISVEFDDHILWTVCFSERLRFILSILCFGPFRSIISTNCSRWVRQQFKFSRLNLWIFELVNMTMTHFYWNGFFLPFPDLLGIGEHP